MNQELRQILKEVIHLFKNQKYRRIFLISFAFTIFFAAAAGYELVTSYQLELKRAKTQAINLSQVLEEEMSGTFKRIDLVMQEIVRAAQDKHVAEQLKRTDILDLISERSKDVPESKTFFIVDKNGFDVFRKKDGKNLFFGDRDYFMDQKKSTEDRLIISRPFIGRMSGVPVIGLSRRIINEKKEFMGIVAATVPLSYFSNLYSKFDIGSEGTITLFSNENIAYARYPQNDFVGKRLFNEDIIDEMATKKESVLYKTRTSHFDGLPRLSSYRKIEDVKLLVAVGISKEEVLAVWKKRLIFYLVSFFTLWIAGAICLLNFLKSLQELEERRKQAIQKIKINSLGEMASGIAHEINNPLTVIASRAIQLRKQIERDQFDPESFKAVLTKINETAERIAKIIMELKSFSRNADRDPFSPVPLRAIVEKALEFCHEKFRHERIALKVDPIPEVVLECREAQLVQVVLDLMCNAFHAVCNLEERWVHLSFVVNVAGSVSMVITDSGKGIPDKIAQKIMEPFFTTKKMGEGCGLGLSISKGIVEDHGGTIYLDSKSANTCFVIELPMSSAESIHLKVA